MDERSARGIVVDLNCDIGEELDDGLDEALFPLISSASVACGGHAGSAASMARSVDRALAHGVAIGAHVSYPDRAGFGRSPVDLTLTALVGALREQVEALRVIAGGQGAAVSYIKPHGALYNSACAEVEIADAVAAVASECGLLLVGMPGSAMEGAAPAGFVAEGFPERGYATATALQPRSQPGALIGDPADVAARAVAMASRSAFDLVDGSQAAVTVRTLCIHSDHPNALANAHAVRAALERAGADVHAFA